MKRTALCLLIALAITGLCSGVVLAQAKSIKVGVVLPLTGEQAKFGEIEKNSFLIALEEVNKAG